MTQRSYSLVSAILFFLVALLHAAGLLRGWHLSIGDMVVPMWASWIGLVIAAFLAYEGFTVSRARMT
jgi:hypothetical protein